MHLTQLLEKSQEFMNEHDRGSVILLRCLYIILGLTLLIMLGMMAYVSIMS